MTKKILQLIVVLLIAAQGVMAQTVKIDSVVKAPGEIMVPINMLNFSDVATITLYIEFDSDLMDFTGIDNTTLTGGWLANYNSSIDKIIITYTASPTGTGYNINGKLLDLKFDYKGGFSSDLVFDEANCEIADNNLAPISSTYEDGFVEQTAAVGTVSMTDLVEPIGNTVNMPVTIVGTGYGAVDAITLKFAYDQTQLTYSGLANSTLSGVVANAGSGVLTLSWTGTAHDYTTLDTLFDVQFTYYGGNAAVAFASGSEIVSALTPLATDYVNGTVTPAAATPTLTINSVGGAPGSSINVPVVASDFGTSNVGAITLTINYDNSKMDYTGYTAQQLSGWLVSENSAGQVTLLWESTAGSTITDNNLVTLNFNCDTINGKANIEFDPGSIVKSVNLVTIPVSFVDGYVGNYSATFTVVGDDTLPILGATLTFDGTTYADSVYYVNGLIDGTYAYTMAKSGYVSATGSVTIVGASVVEAVVLHTAYSVTFTVEDESAAAIADAVITFDGTTYAAGVYVFTGYPNGTYIYSVEKSGYITVNDSVTIAGSNVTEQVVLPTAYSVTFTVEDDGAAAILDAIITFDGTTYAAGVYVFNNLTNGTYVYSVEKSGYITVSDSVTIAGSNVIESVVLHTTYSVTFTVEDDNAASISDAIITFDGTTYAAGVYIFNDLTNGTYVYSVEKTGYMTVNDSVVISGVSVTETVVLHTPYSVSGQITYMGFATRPMGTAGSSATMVYLKNPADSTIAYTTTTDASGNYMFSNIIMGTYFLDGSTTINDSLAYDLTDAFIIFGIGNTLTGLEALAADVNYDGNVDQTDAFIVYGSVLDSNTKGLSWFAPDWFFENPTVVVNANINQDFEAIASGDANGDFVPIP